MRSFAAPLLVSLLILPVCEIAIPAYADENVNCTTAKHPNFDFSCATYPNKSPTNPSKICGRGYSTTYEHGDCVCVGEDDCKAATFKDPDGKTQSVTGQTGGTGGGFGGLNIGQILTGLGLLMTVIGQTGTGATGAQSPTAQQRCTTYYKSDTPTSDPCAYYVPSTSSNITTSGIDISSSFSSSSPDVSDLFNNIQGTSDQTDVSTRFNDITDIDTGGQGTTQTPTSTRAGTSTVNIGGVGQGQMRPGVSGDVIITQNGATVIVTRNGTSTTVAGFYGSETVGANTQQGVVAYWCRSRPWATNFLRFIIPATFFDSLCTLKGYKVGTGEANKSPTVTMPTSFSTQQTSGQKGAAASNGPKPQADIWAVPASVKLGARTTIFWSAKNVASCQESSPDGNFSQTSLSGGAATVALSGPTTFTIVCTTEDGTHVSDYVTVYLGN